MHEEDQFNEDEGEFGPSRSEERREALAVLELAKRLVEQPEARLVQIPMDEDLRDLARAAQRITAQIAHKRQVQFLAKHLRREEPEALDAIRAALDHDKSDHRREAQALHQVEYWRDRLVAEGDAALSHYTYGYADALRDEIMDVKVELKAKLLETELSLRELMELRPGDIIPVEMPENLLVFVEDLPTFHAKMGRTKENVALKIVDKIKRPDGVKTEMHLVTRGGVRIDGEAELEELERSISDKHPD